LAGSLLTVKPRFYLFKQTFMKKLWICGALALALGACKSGSNWTQADKDAFVGKCVPESQRQAGMSESKAKDYCDCMLDKVQKKYPKAQEAGNMSVNEATEMARDCVK
jgi:hypothetical protein